MEVIRGGGGKFKIEHHDVAVICGRRNDDEHVDEIEK